MKTTRNIVINTNDTIDGQISSVARRRIVAGSVFRCAYQKVDPVVYQHSASKYRDLPRCEIGVAGTTDVVAQALNVRGQVAFDAFLGGPSRFGAFVSHDATTSAIALAGDPDPAAANFGFVIAPSLTTRGDVIFTTSGFFLGDGRRAVPLCRAETPRRAAVARIWAEAMLPIPRG
jgi:hypothetical protein